MSLVVKYLGNSPLLADLIQSLETTDLLKRIHEQFDRVSIAWDEEVEPSKWSWDTQEIKLHPSLQRDPEQLRFYLIFELCNASQTGEFKGIKASSIEDFVEAFERIEYGALLETIQIIGCERFRHFESFEEHYLFQQLQGHSARIAQENYPEKTYQGSTSVLTKQEKAVLHACLKCKLMKDEKRFSRFSPHLPRQFQSLQFP